MKVLYEEAWGMLPVRGGMDVDVRAAGYRKEGSLLTASGNIRPELGQATRLCYQNTTEQQVRPPPQPPFCPERRLGATGGQPDAGHRRACLTNEEECTLGAEQRNTRQQLDGLYLAPAPSGCQPKLTRNAAAPGKRHFAPLPR